MADNERLYTYSVVKHPMEEDKKKGARSQLIVAPVPYFLARSEDEVMMLATKSIPVEHMAEADRIEVAVRPF